MRKPIVFLLMAALFLTVVATAAAERPPTATDNGRTITGTILSVGYATGDILLYQDGGSLLTLYGLKQSRLRDIGAGDRVIVTVREDLEVATIERIDL